MKLSIVSTLYNSAPFIREFYERIVPVAEACTEDFEIVFVNDGSPDHVGDVARKIVDSDPRVRLIDLSRNFGHHYAAVAGLDAAEGELIFIIDVDLEEQPEWLSQFWSAMHEDDVDVVFGLQQKRKGKWFNRVSGEIFWRAFNLLSHMEIPLFPCTVRLMRRSYVQALLRLPDRALFLAGNYAWTGFRQKAIKVNKIPRPTRSNYTLMRKVDLLINAIVSFSEYPLRLVFYLGVCMTIVFGVVAGYLIGKKLVDPDSVFMGWTSVIVSIWFMGGMIITCIGIISIYLSKIFIEVKARPRYIVRETYRHQAVRAETIETAHSESHPPETTQ